MPDFADLFGPNLDGDFVGVMLPPELQLSDAIEEGNYPRAYALLRRLTEPLRGSGAASCLTAAFHRTLKLFRAVLDACAPETLIGDLTLHSSDATFVFRGTMLVLAAAGGGPAHVRLLLERGYDVNAASPESADRDNFNSVCAGREYRRCAMPGNELTRWSEGEPPLEIHGLTPLAAALAADNVFTAELLLRTPGVWKTESSAVCRAAALHADRRSLQPLWVVTDWTAPETPPGLPCTTPPGRSGIDIRDTLFPRANMFPASFADLCSPALLEAQYRSGACGEDDARAVLEVLARRITARLDPWHFPSVRFLGRADGDAICKKLLLTAKYFPALCREKAQLRTLLLAGVGFSSPERQQERLLRRWRALSGKRRDVSCAGTLITRMSAAQARAMLETLAKGGELYASADAFYPFSLASLRTFLRFVRIVPSPIRRGVSALAQGTLRLETDVRQLQKLFQGGALAGEAKAELLRAAGPRLRPLVLTAPEQTPAEFYDPMLCTDDFRHFSTDDARVGSTERMRALFCGERSEADCLTDLVEMNVFYSCGDQTLSDAPPEFGCASCYHHLAFAPNANALRAFCRLYPGTLSRVLNTPVRGGKIVSIRGVMLAQAAAAGRVETVLYCLEQDPEPDRPCLVSFAGDEESAVGTPLLLALVFGREAVARALLDAGAICDLSREPCFTLLRAATPEGLALAARLPEVGWERLSPAQRALLAAGGAA